ncbi:MAG: MobF family relaxase [Aliarcobacter sp.]|nr:MobF family relaxase [Aliarcobacter sp.]
MLSITNMTSEQASHYHKEEQNYYQKNNEIGVWQGKGVESLNLQGNISHEQFDRLCHGINPITDEVLVDSSKRAGTDLTFSAPKSVSILMELSSNDEELKIRAAHDKAVEETLKFIEENYSQTREQIDGVRNTINTGNLVIAKFQHDTSRELDPQLHTHSFVLNMTQKENGDWRALHNDELFKNKMLFGQMYRNQLAANLKELGYETEVTDARKGLFEVKGVSNELMTEFSKRSEQVQKRFEELKKQYPNMEETKLREMATLDSRKSKDKTLDRTQIRAENLKRAEAIEDISNLVQDCKNIKSEIKELTAKEYLDKAKDILTSKESVFTKEQLLRESMKLSLGTHTLIDFQKEIEKDNELVNFEKNIYSTKEMIEIEKSIIQDAKDLKNSFSEIATKETLNDFAEKNYSTMTIGQKESFTHILNSKDLITGVQGDAGTGKTFMLKAVKDFIEKSETKFELQGLSFTGKAADEIQKEANIDSTTLHSFLNQKEFKENQIYVVDEASMVGSKQMKELIEKAKETNSKIVLIGDTKQFQTLSAGGIFEQLQKDDVMQTSIMSESKRANTETMKSLYKDIKNKDIESAFETLEKNELIKESTDLNEVKEEYLKDKENTLLIASKNSDKNYLNEAIRNDLKFNFSNEKSFEIRENLNLNETEKHFAKYYKEKELVFIQKAFKGLKAGSEAVIESVNQDRNTITIKSKDKEIEIDLKKDGEKIASFQIKSKEFAVGEQVVFTKNDKKLNIKNGQIATIEKIEKNEITFKRGDESLKIDSKKFNYFDYGYAITDYKSQGQTASKVIAVANSDMANTNSLYVQVTRAKDEVKIFTNDLEKFKENSLNSQIKTSTLDYKIKEKEEEMKGNVKPSQNLDLKNTTQQVQPQRVQEQSTQMQQKQDENEKSFLDRVEQLDSTIENVREIKEFVENNKDSFVDIAEVITNRETFDFAKEMIEEFGIKNIDKEMLEDYTSTAKALFEESAKNKDIDFKGLMKDVMTHKFETQILNAIENSL